MVNVLVWRDLTTSIPFLKMTFSEIDKLKETNYTLIAQPELNYWFAISSKKLIDHFIKSFGDDFNLILYSSKEKDTDYYVLPFKVIKGLFKEEFYSNDKKTTYTGKRWVGTIKDHLLKVTNNPTTIDIKEYFANPYFFQSKGLDESSNDYEIENKRQEINVRIKQSKFRQRVLANFNNSCCISNLKEQSLLIASHIIPWADKKETRLDPTNGLSLSVLYDKLFDKGFFTISDQLEIVTISDHTNLSKPLIDILNEINGKQISIPIREIKKDFLEYHRTKIFMERDKRTISIKSKQP